MFAAHSACLILQSHMALASHLEPDPLQLLRLGYAREISAAAGIPLEGRVAAAFASIPREKFVGPPPWRIVPPRRRGRFLSSDPAALYQDVLVALGCEPGLNNGQPSLHALCLDALAPKLDEGAVHVGAGTGYYTAILAQLVGAAGRVDAYEIEPDLAARAAANLAEYELVTVHSRSGVDGPLPACDVIYVNAAAAEPVAAWLDALRPGGRLLFPLASRDGTGAMLLLTQGSETEYAARFLCDVQFVPCVGAQDEDAGKALHAAFRRKSWREVRRLIRDSAPDATCWLAGKGWWMA